jgi:hypothetical protein
MSTHASIIRIMLHISPPVALPLRGPDPSRSASYTTSPAPTTSSQKAALSARETAEETGYALDALRALPVRMYSRAPAVGAEDSGPTQVEEAVCEEPFMCTIREYGTTVSKRKEGETRTATTDDRLVGHGPRHTKIIWWYLAELIDDDAPSISHEERRDEDKIYRSEFVNASEVLQRATFEQDREILRKALELVKGTYGVE